MRNSRKKGYYFYRTLFISILLCIAITSAVMVTRYFDRYEEQIDKIYSNQKLVHSYIDQIVSNHLISNIENLKILSKIEDLQSSYLDENFQSVLVNPSVFDALMILDGNGTEKFKLINGNIEGEDYSNAFYAEEVMSIEDTEILIASIPQETYKNYQPLITMAVSSSNQNRLGEYLFAVIGTDYMIEEIESLYHDNQNDLFGIEKSSYSYSDRNQIVLTTGNDDIFESLQIDLTQTENSGGIVQEFSKNGLYTVSPINLSNQDFEYFKLNDSNLDILLVTFIPYETFLSISQEVFTNQMGFGMILFSILLICFIVISVKMNESNYNQEIVNRHTTYDFQTGCYNKHAGIGFLSKVFELSKRKSCTLSLVSLNISGLSGDYGGDEDSDDHCSLIETISNRIRQSDFVIRMSDHDFLIVLYDCNKEDAAKMINNAFESIGSSYEKNKMVWGIADTVNIESAQLDQLISEANQRMQRNKKKSRIDHMISQLNK